MQKGYPKMIANMFYVSERDERRLQDELPVELHTVIDDTLQQLLQKPNGERALFAIQQYYGLKKEAKTYESIGESLEKPVGRERIRQIIRKGLRDISSKYLFRMRPVLVFLTEAKYERNHGTFEELLENCPSPEQIESLHKQVAERQPAREFLQDCLAGCSPESPCPTCRVRVLLQKTNILDEVLDLSVEWHEGCVGDWRSTPVSILQLGILAANCLKNDKIVNLGQLCKKTEAEMLRTPNFGRKSLIEIKDGLAKYGLSLKLR